MSCCARGYNKSFSDIAERAFSYFKAHKVNFIPSIHKLEMKQKATEFQGTGD